MTTARWALAAIAVAMLAAPATADFPRSYTHTCDGIADTFCYYDDWRGYRNECDIYVEAGGFCKTVIPETVDPDEHDPVNPPPGNIPSSCRAADVVTCANDLLS